MSDSAKGVVFKPLLFILLLVLAGWQIYSCLAGESLVTAPSDVGFLSLGIRSILVLAWVVILVSTPNSAGVFYPLFLGFGAMFLANGTEWMLLIRKIDPFMMNVFDLERIFSVVMVTIGLVIWSMERRRDDMSSRTLSATDSLTGLYNTRYFYQELENEIRRVRRYGRELALVLIRADHLREYNDKHGYGEGDRVLKDMGQSILGYLRRSDMGCRFGANEFAILLPETPTGGAALVGQRLQDRLHDLEFVVGTERHRMSLTVAVVQLKPEEASLGLVRRAEKLLEDATSQGGGMVLKD
jgi:diguanylate cyclase (GGDEF)-like protein